MCHLLLKSLEIKYHLRWCCRIVLAGLLLFNSSVQALTLKQVEQLAIQSDPAIESLKASSRAFTDTSVADETLPDPKLRLGAVNVPVDSFDLEQEQMTQLKIGIVQNFPRGDVRSIKHKQSQYLSKAALSMADDARLRVLKDVRETYLNLYYEISAYQIIRETRALFSELVKITEANYAAGRVNQQDVLLATLELSRLDDRSTNIQAQEEGYRASLAQWIGELAWQDISTQFPELPALPRHIDVNRVITEHPLIRAQDENIHANKQLTEIARQEYKPGWSLLFDYGFRSGHNPDGTERADFATAIVSLDVPLFTGNRQDKTVSASEQKTAAARYSKDDKLRLLKQQYEKDLHQWQRLGEREQLYKNGLLAAAKNNADASLKAYQSGVAEFDALMRARITELDVRLEDIRIRVDRASAQARLLYITGERNDEFN